MTFEIMNKILTAIQQNGSFTYASTDFLKYTRCVSRFAGQSNPDNSVQSNLNNNFIDFNITKISNDERNFIIEKLNSEINDLNLVLKPIALVTDEFVRPLVCLSKNQWGGCSEYLRNPEYPSQTEIFAHCRKQVSFEANQSKINYYKSMIEKLSSSIIPVNVENISSPTPEKEMYIAIPEQDLQKNIADNENKKSIAVPLLVIAGAFIL